MDIIVPPVWSGIYLNIARLLQYSFEDLGFKSKIIEAGQTITSDKCILLGWNLIPEGLVIEKPYFLYQLEPLVLPAWQEKLSNKKALFEKAFRIWDYSSINTKYLGRIGFESEIVPIGYHSKLDEVSVSKFCDFDVLFVGFLTERRQKVLDELQQHCSVTVQPRWGKDFLDALGRSKILVNIHQYNTPTPLEQPRIFFALNNQTFVISEDSTDNVYPKLITSTYDNLVDTILYFLKNQKEREEAKVTVLNAFKEQRMEVILNKIMNRP